MTVSQALEVFQRLVDVPERDLTEKTPKNKGTAVPGRFCYRD